MGNLRMRVAPGQKLSTRSDNTDMVLVTFRRPGAISDFANSVDRLTDRTGSSSKGFFEASSLPRPGYRADTLEVSHTHT